MSFLGVDFISVKFISLAEDVIKKAALSLETSVEVTIVNEEFDLGFLKEELII
jgi:hypothetical protein